MTTAIIHLSDLHYLPGKAESYGVVLGALIHDLNKQIAQMGDTNVYLAFSGDIVQSGSDPSQYESFVDEIGKKLDGINIPRSRRICVPGNHDISTAKVKAQLVEHEGVVSQRLDEEKFNDYISSCPKLLTDKFAEYTEFESRFSDVCLGSRQITGAGHEIGDDIGIYCLNSALCASGGLKAPDGEKIVDKRRLTKKLKIFFPSIRLCT